jgi:hypothetical protein
MSLSHAELQITGRCWLSSCCAHAGGGKVSYSPSIGDEFILHFSFPLWTKPCNCITLNLWFPTCVIVYNTRYIIYGDDDTGEFGSAYSCWPRLQAAVPRCLQAEVPVGENNDS